MIISKYLFAPELKTKFKVLKVHQEPHAESTWFLEYDGHGPIKCYDQLFETTEEDELLSGVGEIEAQIETIDTALLATESNEKTMSFRGNLIKATGIYKENFKYHRSKKDFDYIVLDSLFPLLIDVKTDGLKIGDWLTIEGEALIILPRGTNAFSKEEAAAQRYGGVSKDYVFKVVESYGERYEHHENLHKTLSWVEHIVTGEKYEERVLYERQENEK